MRACHIAVRSLNTVDQLLPSGRGCALSREILDPRAPDLGCTGKVHVILIVTLSLERAAECPTTKGAIPALLAQVRFSVSYSARQILDSPSRLAGGQALRRCALSGLIRLFIDGCKAAKVAAIAITDHHDATFVLYVQKAAEVRGF